MEKTKNERGASSSSSSSFAVELFGPKDLSSSSTYTGHFGSIFGPSSTGLGNNSSLPGIKGQSRKQDVHFINPKSKTPDYTSQKGNGTQSKGRISNYQNETVEPCYLSSSIHYGGQEAYSPILQPSAPRNIFKRDAKDDDPNGSDSNTTSRGNWWQGSVYY